MIHATPSRTASSASTSGQDYRQPPWPLGSHHLVEPPRVMLQHRLVQEENGRQCLVLRRR